MFSTYKNKESDDVIEQAHPGSIAVHPWIPLPRNAPPGERGATFGLKREVAAPKIGAMVKRSGARFSGDTSAADFQHADFIKR